jgi:hypothetical protein
MRTKDEPQQELFRTLPMEELVPASHPLRAIRKRADADLARQWWRRMRSFWARTFHRGWHAGSSLGWGQDLSAYLESSLVAMPRPFILGLAGSLQLNLLCGAQCSTVRRMGVW